MKKAKRSNSIASGLCDVEALVGRSLDDVEKALILATLGRCGGNRTWAAEILGISVRTLRNKILRYQDTEEVPGRSGRMSRADEDTYLALLSDFDPGRRAPS